MTGRTIRRGARAAISIVALCALVVGGPLVLVALSRARFGSRSPLGGLEPPWRWSLRGIGRRLSEPLSDGMMADLVLRSCLTVLWIALAIVVVTTVAETAHMVRHGGYRMPQVRGLGWAQRLAGLIATGLVAALPLAQSVPAIALDIERAHGDAPSPAPRTAPALVVGGAIVTGSDVDTPDAAPPDVEDGATTHLVRRGESVYSIACDLASGDTARTVAIADALLDANLGRVMAGGQRFSNPAYIEVGWQLIIPPGVREHPVESDHSIEANAVVVEPGDTLSGIAREHLGDSSEWPQIWDANAGEPMGGGRTFDDPDLILPGWTLDLPPHPTDVDSDGTAVPPTDEEAAGEPDEALPIDETAAPPGVRDAPAPSERPAVPGGPAGEAAEPAPRPDAGALPPSSRVTPTPSPLVDVPTSPPDESRLPPPTTAPTASATQSDVPLPETSPAVAVPTSTTTVQPVAGEGTDRPEPLRGPSPLRMEHAALVAAGVLALAAIRRRQQLRRARPRARLPRPSDEVEAMQRRMRSVDAGERAERIDIAVRAAAHELVESGQQIGCVLAGTDGAVTVVATGAIELPGPWTGHGATWTLPGGTPIELLSASARRVGTPCPALVQLGVGADGGDVLVDLEAAGTFVVEAEPAQADAVVRGLATALAASVHAETAHLVVAGLDEHVLLGHPNTHRAADADAALDVSVALVGSTLALPRTTFELRSLRTGGEAWEPAIALLTAADLAAAPSLAFEHPAGHGLALVLAADHPGLAGVDIAARLVATAGGWTLRAFGADLAVTPIGMTADDVAGVAELVAESSRPVDDVTHSPVDGPAGAASDEVPLAEPSIVVELMGPVGVRDTDGNAGQFERSKTVELIAWLVTHRERATRSAARTALWELDVRDATFANVVSEARRAMARLVPPPDGEEWLGRTLTEELPLDPGVMSDAVLIEQRVRRAEIEPPELAISTLRPAVELIRGMPFSGTNYLWPEAEGIASNLVLLATTAAADLAGHGLSIGDTELVFWATGKGLAVLPGHEELIGLRMRAHARAGDLAGVRAEWESYERVITADPWSDGEPAPKLLALRHDLLSPSTAPAPSPTPTPTPTAPTSTSTGPTPSP